MWKLWTAGILGSMIAIVPFLGFPPDWKDVLAVMFGVAVAILAFWTAAGKKAA